MKISMLLYPELTLLDLMGPLQVWNHWPGANIELVAASLEPVRSDSAATILPTHTFETASDAPGILFVPGGMEGMVRASGYLQGAEDLRSIPLRVNADGTPVLLSNVAEVRVGPEMRRGIADLNGEGEVVGGIVIMPRRSAAGRI